MQDIIKKAKEDAIIVRERAYAPYSLYKVGAALIDSNDEVFTGCNVENSSSPLTICAEANAIGKAVSEGKSDFKAIVVVTSNGGTPCGGCRHAILEVCGDIPVHVFDLQGKEEVYQSKDLLPEVFKLKKRDE